MVAFIKPKHVHHTMEQRNSVSNSQEMVRNALEIQLLLRLHAEIDNVRIHQQLQTIVIVKTSLLDVSLMEIMDV